MALTIQEKIQKLEEWFRDAYHRLPESSGLMLPLPSIDFVYRTLVIAQGRYQVVDAEMEGIDCGAVDGPNLIKVIERGYTIPILFLGLLSKLLNPYSYPNINFNDLIKEMLPLGSQFLED